MQANVNGNEREVEEMRLSYEEKLKAAEKAKENSIDHKMNLIMQEKKTKPHLFNLNFDPQLSGKLIHILNKPNNELGNRKGHESDILIMGPGCVLCHILFFTYS